ncbi:hypothetical protein ACTJKJ_08715 [Roseateles sp. 22389]|uniref:hypothetical protein n=1 Tax=Roseateles sp. 22389 TaxID=3453916 RepID=UPI003F87CEE7
MKFDEISQLGRLHVFGGVTDSRYAWLLKGRADRVPASGTERPDETPGVFSLRTLLLGTERREMWKIDLGTFPFQDAALLDFHAATADRDDSVFDLDVMGVSIGVKLQAVARCTLSPLWEHPGGQEPDAADELLVSAYSLRAGSMRIAVSHAPAVAAALQGLDASRDVELVTDGIEYTAKVVAPDGTGIDSRVKLVVQADGAGRLVLLRKQEPKADAAWRQVWRALNDIAACTKRTAWSRLSFRVDEKLPQLSWRATRKDGKIAIVWDEARFDDDAAEITLADQPLESVRLPAASVMRLNRGATLRLGRGTLVVETFGAGKAPDLAYTWSAVPDPTTGRPVEALALVQSIPFVHAAPTVRATLRGIHAGREQEGGTVIGFMMLDDGWAEIPFAHDLADDRKLPAVMVPRDVDNARGSLRIGNRRHEFHEPGATPLVAPWNLVIDEPSDFSARFEFDLASGRLLAAQIGLSGSAMTARGMAWLAATAPDGDDALPRVSDDADAFFDIMLQRCEGKPDAAPFLVSKLRMQAPAMPDGGWDAFTAAHERQPSVDAAHALTVNAPVLSPSQREQRVWLRHPTLPSIQVVSATRSDTASTRPHTSRSLTPFTRSAAPLELEGTMTLLPALAAATAASFSAPSVKGDKARPLVPLASLTLAGFELLPGRPGQFKVCSHYNLPVWDDLYVRAVVPPPDDVEKVPPPVVTALQPTRLGQLMDEAARLRDGAAVKHSLMFGEGAFNADVASAPGNLMPGLTWTALQQVDPSMVLSVDLIRFGAATISAKLPDGKDGEPWTATGDALLEGPKRKLLIKDTHCFVEPEGDFSLVGWSVVERLENGYVRDGLGVSVAQAVKQGPFLLTRDMKNVVGAPFQLVTTTEPVVVEGPHGVDWRFTLTDAPVEKGGLMPGASGAPVWSLSRARTASEDLAIVPLPIGGCLRFVPTALRKLDIATGSVALAEIDGTLVLGVDNPALAQDSLRSVTLRLEGADGKLKLSGVAVNDPSGRIAWELDAAAEDSLWGGSARLSGTLALAPDKGLLYVQNARMSAYVLRGEMEVEVPSFDASAVEIDLTGSAPARPLDVTLASCKLDLARGRLAALAISVMLRGGVACTVAHTQPYGQKGATTASSDWFGNELSWQARMDASRGTFVLEQPGAASPLVFFPGGSPGTVAGGVACIACEPVEAGGLRLASHFFELAIACGELQVTHMLRSDASGSEADTFRFDGTWRLRSLIAWPMLPRVVIDAQDSVVVDFAGRRQLVHEAAITLADHRMDGRAVKLGPKGKGIGPAASTPEAVRTWLAEAKHTFSPDRGDAVLQFQCLASLQFWQAGALAGFLESVRLPGKNSVFGFVPGYIGGDPTKSFLRPGVRRIDQGHAGLFDRQVTDALKKLPAETWLLLGGMTALCPDGAQRHALLHMPFIAGICDGNVAQPLADKLAPHAVGGTQTLRMSRHDVLTTRMAITEGAAVSTGALVVRPLPRDLPFARDMRPADAVSGEALSRGWFDADGMRVAGWHVEQIQRPGPTPYNADELKALPFVYPRAAVMLADLFATPGIGSTQDALSIVGRIPAREGRLKDRLPMKVYVKLVALPPRHSAAPNGPEVAAPRGDLIVGSSSGVASAVLSEADLQVRDPKHFIAVALRLASDPAYVICRRVGTTIAYEVIDLPGRQEDPLEAPVAPLRAAAAKAPDGRITWPSPGRSRAGDLDLLVHPRVPRQYSAPVALAAVEGHVEMRAQGEPFALTEDDPGPTDTVWMQEWEHVAFETRAAPPDDAAPWMRDAGAPTRPVVPSVTQISRALLRMDPALANQVPTIQTYLPFLTDTLEFSTRTGAFVQMGLRGLRSVNAVHRPAEPAEAGPAVMRAFRRPRPVALPPNEDQPDTWRRTVGWYGLPGQSCLALADEWDSVAAPSNDQGLPAWCLFIGRAMPAELEPGESPDSPKRWRGSVTVQCRVKDANRDLPDPAGIVLQLLEFAATDESLRTGVRAGSNWIPFSGVERLDDNRLLFKVPKLTEPPGAGRCTFECGFIPGPEVPSPASGGLQLKPPVRMGLDRVEFRMLTLSARHLPRDLFPLPLRRRTVFFADPSFDRHVSRSDPLSVSQSFTAGQSDEVFNAWVDRQSVSPDETIVLCAKAGPRRPDGSFWLEAKVLRRGAKEDEHMRFELGPGDTRDSVPLDANRYYVLPLGMLRSAKALGAPRAGDALMLDVVWAPTVDPTLKLERRASLVLPVKSRSCLPPPQAMYSLIGYDTANLKAWCAAHSSVPAPDTMTTQVLPATGTQQDRLLRRGVFRWTSVDRPGKARLGYSILKFDKTTESTHVPGRPELEEDVERRVALQ